MKVTSRYLRIEDLEFACHLRDQAGWNQTVADWRNLIEMESAACFLALADGVPVGTVSLIFYGQTLAWIGMLLVEESYRGCGVGKALLNKAIHEAEERKIGCIGLDATPAGRPLYAKHGFVERAQVFRWGGVPIGAGAALPPISKLDWPALESFDAKIFGVSRVQWLRQLARAAHTVLFKTGDKILGYGMRRRGEQASYLGPVVAVDSTSAAAIVNALTAHRPQASVYWDCATAAAASLLSPQDYGLVIQRPLFRMMRGTPLHQDMHCQIAIADPSTG